MSNVNDLPKEAAFAIFENRNYHCDDDQHVTIRWVESQAALRDFLVKNMGEASRYRVMNLRPVVFDFDVSVRFD